MRKFISALVLLALCTVSHPTSAQTIHPSVCAGGQPFPELVILNGLPGGSQMIFSFHFGKVLTGITTEGKTGVQEMAQYPVEHPNKKGTPRPFASSLHALGDAGGAAMLLYLAFDPRKVEDGIPSARSLTWMVRGGSASMTWTLFLGPDSVIAVTGGPMPTSSTVVWRCVVRA